MFYEYFSAWNLFLFMLTFLFVCVVSAHYTYEWITLAVLEFPYFTWTHVGKPLLSKFGQVCSGRILDCCCDNVTLRNTLLDPIIKTIWIPMSVKYLRLFDFVCSWIYYYNVQTPIVIITKRRGRINRYWFIIYRDSSKVSGIEPTWWYLDPHQFNFLRSHSTKFQI